MRIRHNTAGIRQLALTLLVSSRCEVFPPRNVI